jgi:hypothetical protein
MNRICKIKKNYIVNKNIKYNIICFCLFRLKNTYKNFSEYFDGLITFLNYIENNDIKYNIKIRFYYDESIYNTDNKDEFKHIKNTMDKIKKNNTFQLVKYNCKYGGIFPFFFRYIDLFDFPDNDTNYVMITDIDIARKENYCEYIFNLFYKVIELKTDFSFALPHCYIPFWSKFYNNITMVLGAYNSGKYKFDHKILLNFIDDAVHKKSNAIKLFYKNYVDYINNKNIPQEFKKKKLFTYQEDKTWVYGLDEFFLSFILVPYARKLNINIYAHYSNSGKPKNLYALVSELLNNVVNNKNNNTKTIKIYQLILNKMYNTEININNVIKKLSEFISGLKEHDYEDKTNNKYLYDTFYKYIMKYYSSDKYKKYLNLNITNNFNCFVKNNKYYNDYNNFVKLL